MLDISWREARGLQMGCLLKATAQLCQLIQLEQKSIEKNLSFLTRARVQHVIWKVPMF